MSVEDVLRRLSVLEKRVTSLERRTNKQDVEDAEIKGQISQLRSEFDNMKDDVMAQITKFTDRVWKLIFVLVFIIAALAGVKEVPKLW